MQNQKSALGLDGNVTALIGYIIGIVALVLVFIEKDNKWVRFHALQATLYHVCFLVLIIAFSLVVGILTAILAQVSPALALVGSLLYLLVLVFWLAWLAGMIFAAVKAYQGAEFKLPIVGNLAEKWNS